MIKNFPVFPTQPRFKLGDIIIHKQEGEVPHEGVVLYTSFSMIVGLSYCSEESHYVGWSYQVSTYKEISKYNNRIEVDYYSDVENSYIEEFHIVSIYDEGEEFYNIKSNSIVRNLLERQQEKEDRYLISQQSKGKNGLYKLFEQRTIRDDYYDHDPGDFQTDSKPDKS